MDKPNELMVKMAEFVVEHHAELSGMATSSQCKICGAASYKSFTVANHKPNCIVPQAKLILLLAGKPVS